MLDIGANIGLFSVLAAVHGCHALAFEPLAENHDRLLASLQRNKVAHRVRLLKHAVGKRYAPVTLGFRASNPGSSSIGLEAAVQETVESITIDGLLAGPQADAFLGMQADPDGSGTPLVLPRITGSAINFAKIDTEGYDTAVLAGALDTLAAGRVPYLLIEFSPGDARGAAGCSPLAFVQALYAAGYTMYEHGRPFSLAAVEAWVVPHGLSGEGKRVWESWWLLQSAAEALLREGLVKAGPEGAGNPEEEEMAKFSAAAGGTKP